MRSYNNKRRKEYVILCDIMDGSIILSKIVRGVEGDKLHTLSRAGEMWVALVNGVTHTPTAATGEAPYCN